MQPLYPNRFFVFLNSLLVLITAIPGWCNQPGCSPSVMNHGGPDYFGYTWIDNFNEPRGPVYNWIEIATPANNTRLNGDDSWSTNLPLGFAFRFYGAERTALYLNINGILAFTPPAMLNRYAVNPLSTDLAIDTTTNGEGIYKWTNNTDTTIVQWNAHYFTDGTRVKFEVILLGSGDVLIQYDTVNVRNTNYHVGLEAGIRFFPLDSAHVAPRSVIRIYYPGNNSTPNRELLPQQWSLCAYPNPFNSTSNIQVVLPQTDEVTLDLFNGNGQFVRSIYRGRAIAGVHAYRLNGYGLASGNYYLFARTQSIYHSIPIVFLK